MQKEQLLNLLDPVARDAFERARSLARARGGVLSPLHLLVALLTGTPSLHARSASLLRSATEVLLARFPLAAQSLTVTKDTQAVLCAAGEMASLVIAADECLPPTAPPLWKGSGPRMTATWRPVLTSQTRAVPSSLAVTRRRPSGE